MPGWFDFDGIYLDAVARAPERGAHFVEIGVLFGRSTIFMAQAIQKSGKQIAFDAIDPFAHSKEEMEKEIRVLSERYGAWRELRPVIERCKSLFKAFHYFAIKAGVEDVVRVCQQPAQERAHCYSDESLDFVFVDAQHTYEDTLEILTAYLPKIKPGGVLAGHDYQESWPGVVRAVDDSFGGRHDVLGASFIYRKPAPMTKG